MKNIFIKLAATSILIITIFLPTEGWAWAWWDNYVYFTKNGTTTNVQLNAGGYATQIDIGNVTSLVLTGAQAHFWCSNDAYSAPNGGQFMYRLWDLTGSSEKIPITPQSFSHSYSGNDYTGNWSGGNINLLQGATLCSQYELKVNVQLWGGNCNPVFLGGNDQNSGYSNLDRYIIIKFTYVRTTAAPTLTGSSVCYGSTGTITVSNHVSGDSYELWNAAGSSQITSGVSISGGTITVPASLLTSTTQFKVKNTCNGQMSSATATINVYKVPTISGITSTPEHSTSDDGSLIVSFTTTSGDGNINVAWSGTESGSATNITSPYTITGLHTGTYTVVLTNSGLGTCTASQAANTVAQILCTPPTTPTLSAGSPICYGTTGSITINNYNGTSYNYELWNAANSSKIQNIDAATFSTPSLTTTTTYTVRAINKSDADCYSTATVEIAVTPNVVLPTTITGSTVCAGSNGTVTLAGYNDASYSYTLLNASDNNPVSPTPAYSAGVFTVANMSATSTYKVKVTNKSNTNCYAISSTVTITVNQASELSNGYIYFLKPSGWGQPKSYIYNPNNCLGNWNDASLNMTLLSGNLYYINLSTCATASNVILYNTLNDGERFTTALIDGAFYGNDGNIISFTASGSLITYGNNGTITVSPYSGYTFALYDATNTNPVAATYSNGVFTIATPAIGTNTYTIRMQTPELANNCLYIKKTAVITVYSKPDITLSVSPSSIYEGDAFTITATLSNTVPFAITIPLVLDNTSPDTMYLKGIGDYKNPAKIIIQANASSASKTFYTTNNLYPENTRNIKYNHGIIVDSANTGQNYTITGNPVAIAIQDKDDNICSQSVYPESTYSNSNIMQLPPDTIRDLSHYEYGARVFTTAYAAKEDTIVVEFNTFWDAGWSSTAMGGLEKYIDDNVYIHVWVQVNGVNKVVADKQKMIRAFEHNDADNNQDFAIYYKKIILHDAVVAGIITQEQLDTISTYYYTIKKNPDLSGGGLGDNAKWLHHTQVAITPHYQNIDYGESTSTFTYTHSLSATNDIATMAPNPANMCYAYYKLDNNVPVEISSDLRSGNGSYTIPAISGLSAGIHTIVATSYTTGGGMLSDTIYIAVNPAVVLTVNSGTSATINETGTPNSATITATLQNGALAPGDVVVTLNISGGASGVDYSLSPTTITIPKGQNSASITLTAIDNTVCNDVNLTITAVNPIPCAIIPTLYLASESSLSVTIRNNTGMPQLSLAFTGVTCSPNDVITINVSGGKTFTGNKYDIRIDNGSSQNLQSSGWTTSFAASGLHKIEVIDTQGCTASRKLNVVK
ncbi:hypothetical protein FACS1894178_1450 [Bacteroidia bacterium]|nr:hypothetical protein FACS1894178_1450 [Bacteroidia bacterium]